MISESQRAVIHGLRDLRNQLQEQITKIDILLLNATSIEDQVVELERCTTDLTHRELSAAELAREGIPVLGTTRRPS